MAADGPGEVAGRDHGEVLVAVPGLDASLTVTTSVIMGVVVTVAALALPVNLLSKFTLKGDPA